MFEEVELKEERSKEFWFGIFNIKFTFLFILDKILFFLVYSDFYINKLRIYINFLLFIWFISYFFIGFDFIYKYYVCIWRI